MSKEGSLKPGYEYCGCHPETCSHFDGIRYVGLPSNEEFKIDEDSKQRVLTDEDFISASAVVKLFSKHGIELSLNHNNKDNGLDEPTTLTEKGYYKELNIHSISYQVKARSKYTEIHHKRYSISDAFNYILKHQSKNRKDLYDKFLKSL